MSLFPLSFPPCFASVAFVFGLLSVCWLRMILPGGKKLTFDLSSTEAVPPPGSVLLVRLYMHFMLSYLYR